MELLLWDFDDKNICVSCRRWSGNSHRHDDPTFPFGGVPKSRVATGLVALSEAVQILGVFFFFESLSGQFIFQVQKAAASVQSEEQLMLPTTKRS